MPIEADIGLSTEAESSNVITVPSAIQSPVSGLIQLIVLSFLPVLVFGLIFNLGKVGEWLRRTGRRLGMVRPEPPIPLGPPIERLAQDARRLARDLDRLPERAPWVRRRGILLAYDEVLTQSCRALDVEHRLAQIPLGIRRDAERQRVETALEEAGLVLRPEHSA